MPTYNIPGPGTYGLENVTELTLGGNLVNSSNPLPTTAPIPTPTSGSSLIFKPVKAVAITAGTPVAVWIPTTGKKFRLLGYCLGGSASTSILFEDATGAGNEFLRTPLPQSTNTTAQSVYLGPVGYLSVLVNNQLFLDVTTGATLSGYIYGLEE